MAAHGWDQWLSADGGYIYKRDSGVGKKIAQLFAAEAQKPTAQVLPLYLEYGVYNFYLHMGKGSSALPVDASGLAPPVPPPLLLPSFSLLQVSGFNVRCRRTSPPQDTKAVRLARIFVSYREL